ncbi:hypothetical protein ACWC24_13070 [Streptomyces sp. NPDC001443]
MNEPRTERRAARTRPSPAGAVILLLALAGALLAAVLPTEGGAASEPPRRTLVTRLAAKPRPADLDAISARAAAVRADLVLLVPPERQALPPQVTDRRPAWTPDAALARSIAEMKPPAVLSFTAAPDLGGAARALPPSVEAVDDSGAVLRAADVPEPEQPGPSPVRVMGLLAVGLLLAPTTRALIRQGRRPGPARRPGSAPPSRPAPPRHPSYDRAADPGATGTARTGPTGSTGLDETGTGMPGTSVNGAPLNGVPVNGTGVTAAGPGAPEAAPRVPEAPLRPPGGRPQPLPPAEDRPPAPASGDSRPPTPRYFDIRAFAETLTGPEIGPQCPGCGSFDLDENSARTAVTCRSCAQLWQPDAQGLPPRLLLQPEHIARGLGGHGGDT